MFPIAGYICGIIPDLTAIPTALPLILLLAYVAFPYMELQIFELISSEA